MGLAGLFIGSRRRLLWPRGEAAFALARACGAQQRCRLGEHRVDRPGRRRGERLGGAGPGCAQVLVNWERLRESRAFPSRQAGAGTGAPRGRGPDDWTAAPAGPGGPSDQQGAGGSWARRQNPGRATLAHHPGPVRLLRGAGESRGCPLPGWGSPDADLLPKFAQRESGRIHLPGSPFPPLRKWTRF